MERLHHDVLCEQSCAIFLFMKMMTFCHVPIVASVLIDVCEL